MAAAMLAWAPHFPSTIYKAETCTCCKGWITNIRRAGFNPTVREVQDLNPIRAQYGVRFTLSSCHTARVGGYVVEGHVPPADVARLLKERPKVLGLIVPGMPVGSPGMEMTDGQKEPY